MIELIKVILLGIIEGITEWLPISSTGHLIIGEEFLKLNVSAKFWEMFLICIQLGAICAVIVLYWQKLFPFYISPSKGVPKIKSISFKLWLLIGVATLPAMVVGITLDDWFDKYFYNFPVVACMLIVYGLAFIYLEKRNHYLEKKGYQPPIDSIQKMDIKSAFLIGLFQVLAIIPGTSRSGATIVGGMLIGTSRKVVTEFTFYMAIPIMFGASFLKLIKHGFVFSPTEIVFLLVGMIVAFLVSIFAIKFLVKYISRNDFTGFGIYRILLGSILIIYYIVKLIINR